MDTESIAITATEILGAYLSNNPIARGDLPDLIAETFKAVRNAAAGPVAPAEPEIARPARAFTGSVKASVKPDGIVSMIDGKPYKTLRRHLTTHGYTPESYREAFDLPADYPLVAANYAAQRRDLALASGLGRKAA